MRDGQRAEESMFTLILWWCRLKIQIKASKITTAIYRFLTKIL